MAFEKRPQSHITGLVIVAASGAVPASPTGDWLLIPRSSIPQLTTAECDATTPSTPETTGDIRKVAFALQDMLYQVYANMAVADRPVNWKSYRSPGTEDDDGNATRSYTNQFEISVSAVEVKAE